MKAMILLILFSIHVDLIHAQDSWQLAKNKDGIKVYVGEITGSDYYAFKAVMTVKSTEAEIVKFIRDVNKYPAWFAYTASAKLIDQNADKLVLFMETDYPWPYSNECMNYSMVFHELQGMSLKVTINGINESTDCAHSLKTGNGYLLLEPDNGSTKITYYFHSEPSQNIPPWLINPRIHDMPYKTFRALREKLYASQR